MVVVKLKNVSIKNGERFRHNQNYTLILYDKDGVNENSTIEDITKFLIGKYPNKLKINKFSQIIINE